MHTYHCSWVLTSGCLRIQFVKVFTTHDLWFIHNTQLSRFCMFLEPSRHCESGENDSGSPCYEAFYWYSLMPLVVCRPVLSRRPNYHRDRCGQGDFPFCPRNSLPVQPFSRYDQFLTTAWVLRFFFRLFIPIVISPFLTYQRRFTCSVVFCIGCY